MNFLLFTCPVTGKDFSSHIHADVQTIAYVEKVPVTLQCPVCGGVHRMTVRSGHVGDGILSPPAVSPPIA